MARAIHLLRKALEDNDQTIIRTSYGLGVSLDVPVFQSPSSQPSTGSGLAFMHATFPHAATGEEMIRTAFEIASTRSEENLKLAGAVLDDAFKRHPTLALAPSLHADLKVACMIRGYGRPATESRLAEDLIESALKVIPGLPTALATKGWLLGVINGDCAGGLRLIEQSIANTTNAWLSRFYQSWLLIGQHRLDDALAAIDEGLVVSPLERALLSMKGWLLCAQGEVKTARAFTMNSLVLRPDIDVLWVVNAIILARDQDFEGASQSIARALALSPNDVDIEADEAWLNAISGRPEAALAFLGRRAKSPACVLPVKLAMVRHALGDKLASGNLLKIAESDKDPWRLLAWCDPRLTAV